MKSKVVIAYWWNIFGNVALKSLGIISTLILVRLLSPSDFGMIAIAMMVIGLFDVLSEMGVNRYLILAQKPSDDLYNSAWTLNICLRALSLAVVLILSPMLANFLHNPNLTTLINIFAGISFLKVFHNIGMLQFEKDIEFGPKNKLNITAKLFSFFATIGAAFYFQNYYALAIGTTVNMLSSVVFSYVICPYRPKFNFRFERDMFTFSTTMLTRNIIGYSRSQLDILFTGRLFGDAGVGSFKVAREFSLMPLTQIVTPGIAPMFSLVASVKHDDEILYAKIYQTIFIGLLILLPAAVGMTLVANEFTLLVLGEKWLGVSAFIGLLAFLNLTFFSQQVVFMLYDAKNKPMIAAINDVIGIILLVGAVMLFPMTDLVEFAEIRVIIGVISLTLIFVCARILIALSLKKICIIFSLILIPTLSMYFAMEIARDSLYQASLIPRFCLLTIIGILIYGLTLWLTLNIILRTTSSYFVYNLIPYSVYQYRFFGYCLLPKLKVNNAHQGWMNEKPQKKDKS